MTMYKQKALLKDWAVKCSALAQLCFIVFCVGVGDWGKMLAQWGDRGEGDHDTTSDSSGSNIQSYSEDEGGLKPLADSAVPVSSQPVAIAAISSDEDFADTAPGAVLCGSEVKRSLHRQRRRGKGKGKSAGPDVPIENFNSPSSSDSDDGVLYFDLSKPLKKPSRTLHLLPDRVDSTPPDHMTISTPPSSPVELVYSPDDMAISTPPSSPPLELGDSDDHMTISTPPSSPSEPAEREADRFKTSEWVRQVSASDHVQ